MKREVALRSFGAALPTAASLHDRSSFANFASLADRTAFYAVPPKTLQPRMPSRLRSSRRRNSSMMRR